MKKLLPLIVLLASGCAATVRGFGEDVRDARKDMRLKTKHDHAVALASVIPGGGWIYEENTGHPYGWDVSPGVWYFLATVGGALVVRANSGNSTALILGTAGLATLRFNDIRWSMHYAKEKHKKGEASE